MRRVVGWTASLAVVACALAACGSAPAPGTAPSSPHPSALLRLSASIVGGPALTPVRTPAPLPSPFPVSTPTRARLVPSLPPTPPVPAVARDFAWADREDSPLGEAYTLTLVRGLTPRQALRELVPSRRITSARAAIDAADRLNDVDPDDYDTAPYYQTVLAGERDGWTFVLEDNNFLAVYGGASERLSRRGAAVVMYENIELDTDFQYARGGRLVRDFDTFFHDGRAGRPLPEERGLPFGTHTGQAWMRALELTLARRLTGVRVRPDDLATSRYTLGAAVTLR